MQDLIKDSTTFLVDVRTPAEVAEQSVPGAENIPLDTVPQNLARFKEAKGAVVVFCRSGGRSENAKKWLAQNGVENVHNAGGIAQVLIHKM
jgi:rhodanese-related sulfurtransferase